LDDPLGSDHSPTVTYVNVHLSEDSDTSSKFTFSKADWKSFKANCRTLLTADNLSASNSVNENAKIITDFIIRSAETSIPQGRKSKENAQNL